MSWDFTEDAAFLALCDAYKESGEPSAMEFLAHGEGAFHFQELTQNAAGAVPGPFDCYLVLRGLKTLAVRMDRHCANASAIVEGLFSPQINSCTKAFLLLPT